MYKNINTPVKDKMPDFFPGDRILISGALYTARDAIMPKIADAIINNEINTLPFDLEGAAIMHTAYSQAGFGPRSSNKEAIEGVMGELSKAGVKIHIAKGRMRWR